MKVQVTVKDLPNGSVPFQSVADSNTRNAIMLTNENVVDAGKRCKMLEKAVVELQKNPGGVDDSALQQAVAQANAAKTAAQTAAGTAQGCVTEAQTAAGTATTAKNDAVTAKNDAVTAKNDAVSAKNDAVSAKTDAQTAKGEAETAKTAAESARDTANAKAGEASGSATAAGNSATAAGNSATAAAASAVLAANANIIAFRVYGKDIGANAGAKTFYLADFGLSDSSKTYLVTATFANEAATARTVVLGSTSGSLSASIGARKVLSITVAGGGSFDVDNIATSVNVVICIKFNS